MKTPATFRIDDRLLKAARRMAQANRRPLTAEVEEALGSHLGLPGETRLERLERTAAELQERVDQLEGSRPGALV